MKNNVVKCPMCKLEYNKGLYTLGFIHCAPNGCGVFLGPETLKVLPVNDKGQVITDTQSENLLLKTAEEIGYNNGYKKALQDSQEEIEELNALRLLQTNNFCELLKRKEKSDNENKELKKQIDDTENALTGAITCVEAMKCCGNCDYGTKDCLNAVLGNSCGHWKQKGNK